MTAPSSALTDVVYGGITASTLKNLVQLNASDVPSPTGAARADRFWSSRTDPIDSSAQEVLEINLGATSPVNTVSFQYAHFPQIITLEYMGPDTNNDWVPIVDATSNLPLTIQVSDSFPPTLPDPSTVIGNFHPQHDYNGHWLTFSGRIGTVLAQSIRILMVRNSTGSGPINVTGARISYSLALQNVDIGYRIESDEDIPLAGDEAASLTSSEVFASSTDVLGSEIGFSRKTYYAQNLLGNTDEDARVIWKSEPQPFPQAVVNLYADLRDRDGNPQVIDSIFLDPLYVGSLLNLYFSNDDQSKTKFRSPRRPIPASRIMFSKAAVAKKGVLDLGQPTDNSQTVIDNFIDYDPTSPGWAFGLEWTRPGSPDGLTHVLVDCGTWSITYDDNNYYLRLPNNISLSLPIVYPIVGTEEFVGEDAQGFFAAQSFPSPQAVKLDTDNEPFVATAGLTVPVDATTVEIYDDVDSEYFFTSTPFVGTEKFVGQDTEGFYLAPNFPTPYPVMLDTDQRPFVATPDLTIPVGTPRAYIYDDENHKLFYTSGPYVAPDSSDGSEMLGQVRFLVTAQNDTIEFSVNQNNQISSTNLSVDRTTWDATLPAQLSIGSALDGTGSTGGKVSAVYLSVKLLDNDDYLWDPRTYFLTDPRSYTEVPYVMSSEKHSRFNTILRFDTNWINDTNPTGFFGGPGAAYSDMTWVPIPQSYTMQRGYIKFPAVKAKWWNLEISALRPEPNDKFVPVNRLVRTFPAPVTPKRQITSATSRDNSLDVGMNTQTALAPAVGFTDAPLYTGTGGSVNGLLNTEVYVAQDYQVQEDLSTLGNDWSYRPFHPDRTRYRFDTVGPHKYQMVHVKQTSGVSFFAGLRQLSFHRTAPVIPHNPIVIEDNFIDDSGINMSMNEWMLDNEALIASDLMGQNSISCSSLPYITQNNIKAIQFAAQQSESLTLMQHNMWTGFGDARVIGEVLDPSGDMVTEVSRDRTVGYWADVTLNFGSTYGEIEHLGDPTRTDGVLATYSALGSGTPVTSYVGGATSEDCSVPNAGRLFTAVRVSAPNGLTSPIFLQVIDSLTGDVYGEVEANPGSGGVKQWYVALDLDQIAQPGAGLTLTGSTIQHIAVKLIQKQPSGDTFRIHSAYMFWDPIVWEFSVDGGATWFKWSTEINDPNGVLVFPGNLSGYNTFMWRVSTYSTGVSISNLAIRPWYYGQHGRVPQSVPLPQGPNLIPSDRIPPIEQDPRWAVSTNPIPSWWWNDLGITPPGIMNDGGGMGNVGGMGDSGGDNSIP